MTFARPTCKLARGTRGSRQGSSREPQLPHGVRCTHVSISATLSGRRREALISGITVFIYLFYYLFIYLFIYYFTSFVPRGNCSIAAYRQLSWTSFNVSGLAHLQKIRKSTLTVLDALCCRWSVTTRSLDSKTISSGPTPIVSCTPIPVSFFHGEHSISIGHTRVRR